MVRLGYHAGAGIGAEAASEVLAEFAGHDARAAAEVEAEVFGAMVVGEDGVVEGLWVGGAEGGVGGGGEGRFSWLLLEE